MKTPRQSLPLTNYLHMIGRLCNAALFYQVSPHTLTIVKEALEMDPRVWPYLDAHAKGFLIRTPNFQPPTNTKKTP